MTEAFRIHVADDFSPVPAGRYHRDGKFTGQRFREEYVIPRIRDGGKIVLDIDEVESLPSSFWEEVFGGLVRAGYSRDELKRSVSVVTSEPILSRYLMLAWRFVDEEIARRR